MKVAVALLAGTVIGALLVLPVHGTEAAFVDRAPSGGSWTAQIPTTDDPCASILEDPQIPERHRQKRYEQCLLDLVGGTTGTTTATGPDGTDVVALV